MPSRVELVAYQRTTDEIAQAIGADLVIFQTLPDLVNSVRRFNPSIETFDCSVFTGEYVTGGVSEDYLAELEKTRADNIKNKTMVGGLGPIEGKGGGGLAENVNGINGVVKGEPETAASGPLNGSDTVGLHNSWKLG
jgi:amidophosphoribosyltransferase